MEIIYRLEEMEKVAAEFIAAFPPGKVFGFHGQMGAGKTTFITAICRTLGVHGSLSSPTFSIINEYALQSGGKVYHLDLYRLKNSEEAIQAGVEDVLFSGSTCFVEWPEQAPEIFPEDTVKVSVSIINADTRKLSWS